MCNSTSSTRPSRTSTRKEPSPSAPGQALDETVRRPPGALTWPAGRGTTGGPAGRPPDARTPHRPRRRWRRAATRRRGHALAERWRASAPVFAPPTARSSRSGRGRRRHRTPGRPGSPGPAGGAVRHQHAHGAAPLALLAHSMVGDNGAPARPATAVVTWSSWCRSIGHPLTRSRPARGPRWAWRSARDDTSRGGRRRRPRTRPRRRNFCRAWTPPGCRARADGDQPARGGPDLEDPRCILGCGHGTLHQRDVVGPVDAGPRHLGEVGDPHGAEPAPAVRLRSRAGSAGTRRTRRTSTRQARGRVRRAHRVALHEQPVGQAAVRGRSARPGRRSSGPSWQWPHRPTPHCMLRPARPGLRRVDTAVDEGAAAETHHDLGTAQGRDRPGRLEGRPAAARSPHRRRLPSPGPRRRRRRRRPRQRAPRPRRSSRKRIWSGKRAPTSTKTRCRARPPDVHESHGPTQRGQADTARHDHGVRAVLELVDSPRRPERAPDPDQRTRPGRRRGRR